uniref:DNA-directed RNA polymerase n=1 Tax=Eutreptiella gymnastica TaxID=73025 RepID=I0J3P3_9EUGL|nr:DNA-directed RNA polymerase subunit beta'' [Eutreptiella gymnastica]CCE26516.1 DNA-directed RNA polymerase subunit beta'' [Eutreptiella gymnastica]
MKNFFSNRPFSRAEIQNLIKWFLANYGTVRTAEFADNLKTLGFKYATKAGISLGIDDLKIPLIKTRLITNAHLEIAQNDQRFISGKITEVQRFQKVIDVWHTTGELLKDELITNFRQVSLLNPVYMMAFSGARGNISQVRQLVGMRGLMSDSQGEIIDLPIKSNFREGLNITEYLISCYGARKGLVDTALRTANSGYLTRRLVDVSQSLIINQVDCKTHYGMLVKPLVRNSKTYISVQQRLTGRVIAKSIFDKENQLLVNRNQDVCIYLANKIARNSINRIYIRSPLNCEANKCICQLCYGWSLAHGRLAQLGEAVGVIAAQSIGEPGTQLTMRTFHTGGVFAGNVKDKIYAPHNGILSYSTSSGKIIKTAFGETVFLVLGEMKLYIKETYLNTSTLVLPKFAVIFTKPSKEVFSKQIIAEISSLEEMLPYLNKTDRVEAFKEVRTVISGQVIFDGGLITRKVYMDKFQSILKNKIQVVSDGLVWVLENEIFSYLSLLKRMDILFRTDILFTLKCYKKIKSSYVTFQNSNLVLRALNINYISLNTFPKKYKIRKVFTVLEQIKIFNAARQCLLHTVINQSVLSSKLLLEIKVGKLISKGDKLASTVVSSCSGQILVVKNGYILVRTGVPNLASRDAVLGVKNNGLVSKNNTLFRLIYRKPKTGDIVQGLPKVEELLEARRTKDFSILQDNLHERLRHQFIFYKQVYPLHMAARKSVDKIQQYLVNGIQLVYNSQGISISDKHIEIIVKQMTSKALIGEGGDTSLLSGELIEIHKIEKINLGVNIKAEYEPVLLSITKASLNTESFISSASFQETTKVLVQAALEGKTDWLQSLKENVILGRIIPAGTGISVDEIFQ